MKDNHPISNLLLQLDNAILYVPLFYVEKTMYFW